MKKYMILVITFALSGLISFGQTYKALQVGDQVPDITLRGFFDDDKKTMKISELYRDKLLVLDFWGTWCGACLNDMMTYPALKAEFGDKLNIIAVGYESRERIAGLFKRNPVYHSDQWITLYGDSVLTNQLFPHKLLPHLAWIDGTGQVIAITDGEYFNSKNIRNALNGKEIDARVKRDNENFGVNAIDKPFHLMDSAFTARSIFTRAIPGGLSFDSKQPYNRSKPYKFNRIFLGNETIGGMYWFALFARKIHLDNYAKLKIELKDSLRFMHPKKARQSFNLSAYKSYNAWADSNLYCYDLVLPRQVPDSLIREYMVTDLNRYFNFYGRWERRVIDCYAIQRPKAKVPGQLIAPDKNELLNPEFRETGPVAVRELDQFFNDRIAAGYVINESGIPPKLTISLDTRYRRLNANQIAAMLKKSGLALVQVKRKVLVYVISEK